MSDHTTRAAEEQKIINAATDRVITAVDICYLIPRHIKETIAEAISEACFESVMIERRSVAPVLNMAINAMAPEDFHPVSTEAAIAKLRSARFALWELLNNPPLDAPAPPPEIPQHAAIVADLQAKLAEATATNMQLNERIESQHAIIKRRREQADYDQKTIEEQAAALDGYNQMIAERDRQIENQRQSYTDHISELLAQIDSYRRAEVQSYHAQQRLNERIESQAAATVTYQRQIADITRKHEAAESRWQGECRLRTMLETEIEQLKANVDNYRCIVDTMPDCDPRLDAAIARLEYLRQDGRDMFNEIVNHAAPLVESFQTLFNWISDQDQRRNELQALGATPEQIAAMYDEFFEKVKAAMKAGIGIVNLLIIVE